MKMMSNDELQDFFTIRSVPNGEPVFIFCVFKGKKGDVMTFIDSGANVWLALLGRHGHVTGDKYFILDAPHLLNPI